MQYALREAIKESRGRILDLFREWDEDHSGYIDKKEFGAALKGMGFPCSKADIAKVYGDLDPDGSGRLEYNELNTALRKSHQSRGGKGGAAADAKGKPKKKK